VRRAAVAVAAVVVLALVGYGQLLVPGRIAASPHSDLLAYHLRTKAVLYDSLRRGEGVPRWREDQLGGQPGLTHPQAAWGEPLHALFWLMPPERAAGPTLFLLILVAALGYSALAAALGLGAAGRLFAAVAGLFQAKLVLAAYAGWLGVLPSIALLPWLFWALLRAMVAPGWRTALALAAVAALMLHGGQLQLVYYGALVAAAWCAVRLRDRRAAAAVAAACVAALIASAWLLVPLAREASLLTRAHSSYPFFVGSHALGLRHLATLVRPEALGSPLDHSYVGTELWEDQLYFGLVPLAFAVAAVANKRPHARLLAASCALTLLFAFDTPLLHAVWAVVPGYALFRCPARIAFLTSMFGIALGAVGFEAMLATVPASRRRLTVALAVLFVAGEGVSLARRYLATRPIDEVLPASKLADRLAHEPGRVAVVGLPPESQWPVRPVPSLQQVGGFDAYQLAHYRDYFERMRTGAPPTGEAGVWLQLDRLTDTALADALDVTWIVAPAPDPRFETVATFDDEPYFKLYAGVGRTRLVLMRNRHAAARATLADAAADEVATVVEERAGRLVVQTRTTATRLLRIAEVWHPGWRATVDGVPCPVLRDGVALFAVSLEPGAHRVELRFTSW
jgi:hypothetical protein